MQYIIFYIAPIYIFPNAGWDTVPSNQLQRRWTNKSGRFVVFFIYLFPFIYLFLFFRCAARAITFATFSRLEHTMGLLWSKLTESNQSPSQSLPWLWTQPPSLQGSTLFDENITVAELKLILAKSPNRVHDVCSLSGIQGITKWYYSSDGNPLHAACIRGQLDIVKVLLDHEAPVNAQLAVCFREIQFVLRALC
jgi:hypothetical protein